MYNERLDRRLRVFLSKLMANTCHVRFTNGSWQQFPKTEIGGTHSRPCEISWGIEFVRLAQASPLTPSARVHLLKYVDSQFVIISIGTRFCAEALGLVGAAIRGRGGRATQLTTDVRRPNNASEHRLRIRNCSPRSPIRCTRPSYGKSRSRKFRTEIAPPDLGLSRHRVIRIRLIAVAAVLLLIVPITEFQAEESPVREGTGVSVNEAPPSPDTTGVMPQPQPATQSGAPEAPSVVPGFGAASPRPHFEINQGQFDNKTRFVGSTAGMTAMLADDRIAFVSHPGDSGDGARSVLILKFGAHTQADIAAAGEEPLDGRVNYLVGNDSTRWRTEIQTYAKVRYSDVRPGIDLVFYFNSAGELEYDLEVAPQADLESFGFDVDGADETVIAPSGALRISNSAGGLTLRAPDSFQPSEGSRERVPSRFVLEGSNRFRVAANYDHSKPLTIDPSIAYDTSLPAIGYGIAIDGVGNAVTVGSTTTPPPTFPVTGGVVKDSLSSQRLGYVSKYSQDGSYLIYSTYIGGNSGNTEITGVAVDGSSNAYIAGATNSTDFPAVGPFQLSCTSCGSGKSDGVVAELNESGTAFVYSSFIGGAGIDQVRHLARNSDGSVVIAGIATTSTAFPLTEPPSSASNISFLAAVSADGATLDHSSLFSDDQLIGMGVDGTGRVFAYTGTPFPVGSINGYVHRFEASTYLESLTVLESIRIGFSFTGGIPKFTVDSDGNHFVANSFIWETCADCMPMYYNGAVGKFDADGNKIWQATLNHATFTGLATDGSGNVIAIGSGSQPYVNSISHSGSGFVTMINSSDSQTRFSTQLSSVPRSAALDSSGNIYLAHGGVTKIALGSWSHMSGNVANGSGGIVYANRTSDGDAAGLAAVDGSGNYDLYVPTSGSCPSNGYRLLVDGVPGYITTYYNGKTTAGTADCVTAPSSGVNFGFLPAAPTGVTASSISSYQTRVGWSVYPTDATAISIERRVASGSFVEITQLAPGSVQFDDFDVTPLIQVSYRLRVITPFGISSYSSIASTTPPAPPPPAAPSDLTAVAFTSTEMDLAWTDNSTDEIFFRIERDSGSGFVQVATATANATSYHDSGLSTGTTYWYRVKARNAGSESAYSNVASATAPPPSPPIAPSALTATASAPGKIDLSWTDNSSNESGFKIERNAGSGFTQIGTAGGNVTTHSDQGLSPNATFAYRVRSSNSDGDSAYSNEVTATTVSLAIVSGTVTFGAGGTATLYEATSGLPVSSQSLVTDTYSFVVPAATCPSSGYKLGVTGPSGTTSRWYPAQADLATASCISAPGIANMTLPPSPPSGLGASPRPGTTSQVDLTWSDTSAFESGYKIERDSGGGFVQIATPAANVTSYIDTSLASGATFIYRIRAYNGGGDSPYSATAQTTTMTTVSGTVVNGQWGSVSIYDIATGNQVGYTCCLPSSTYSLVVPLAACGSGAGYKVHFNAPANHESQWYSNKTDYGSADCVAAPGTANATLNPIPPSAPSDLTATATAPAAGRVDIAWTDTSAVETGFKIERDAGSGYTQIATTGANVTAYTDLAVSIGATYSYRVRANNGVSNSPYSNSVAVTVPTPPTPTPPTGLSATPNGPGTIALTWIDNATNETGYRIERDSGSGFTPVATPGANVTAFTDTGLPASTTHAYRVTAVNGGGDSAFSNTAQATVSHLVVVSGTVTNGANGSVAIYEIATGTQLGYTCCLVPNTFSFTVPASSCSSGGGYKLLITAGPGFYSQWYESKGDYASADCIDAPSTVNPVLAQVPPSAPTALTATSVGIGRIDLTWTDTSFNESGFKIERDSGSGFVQIATVGANVRALTNMTLNYSTTYAYRVRAYNSGGDSAFTNEVSATTSNLSTVSGTVINGAGGSISIYDASTGSQVGYQCCLTPNSFNFTVNGSSCAAGGGFKLYVSAPLGYQSQWYLGKSSYTSADCIDPPATGLTIVLSPPPTLPNAPSSLTATATSSSTIALNWTDNSSDETGFRVERDSGSGYVEITTTGPGATSIVDAALVGSTTYNYRVRATNGAGDSAFSNTASATTPASTITIGGTVTNGQWGSVSLFSGSTGTLAGYQCCLEDQTFSFTVPASACPAGGYKLYINAPAGYSSQWYLGKNGYTSADCIDTQTPLSITLSSASTISGYVKDYNTATDLDGLPVYAFDSATGSFAGWTRTGVESPGQYSMSLGPSGNYKLRVAGDIGHEDSWYSGSAGYSEATAITAPGTADFSLRPAATISGAVTQSGVPLPSTYVSAYPSCGCTSPANTVSDQGGNYSVKVLPSAGPGGTTYRIRMIPPAGQTRWYSDSAGFTGATDISAPSSGINQELPP